MPKVKATIEVPYATSAAEALWYDLGRWPSIVDGFGAIRETEGEWPKKGARVIWESTPGGRGRVTETVGEYEVRSSQVVHVDDEKLSGLQRVQFEPLDAATRVALSFDYELKRNGLMMKVTDLVFIRRALRDSLHRTLRRYSLELRDDHEPPL